MILCNSGWWCRPLFSGVFSVNKVLFLMTFALGISFAVVLNYMSEYFYIRTKESVSYKVENKVFSPIPFDFHGEDELSDILDITVRKSDVEKSCKYDYQNLVFFFEISSVSCGLLDLVAATILVNFWE